MIIRTRRKVVIVEPSPVVVRGIRSLLEESGEIEVVGAFPDIDSYRESHGTKEYDIALVNPSVVSSYKQFAIRSMIPDSDDRCIVALLYGYVDHGTLNGFDGALDIYDSGEVMVRKLHKALDHASHSYHSESESVDLSDREKEILASVALGLTNKEIADKHNISIHTVVSHRKNITRKTGIKTVSGLTLYAAFNNLISEDEI